MATTSTIPAVKAKLVELLSAESDVPVFYCWPGPSTPPRCIFLGRHPELDDIRIDAQSEIPTIKAGRKQRQEAYTVPVTVWSFRPDLDSSAGQEAERDAFELATPLVGIVLPSKVDLDLGPAVHRASASTVATTLFPFMKGWACEVVVEVEVTARLS